jgi:hypothetical protein
MQALRQHTSSFALVTAVVGVAAILASAVTGTAKGDPGARPTQFSSYDSQRDALAHAREIRAEVDARYRGPHGTRLAVTEASATSVIDSFTLFASALEMPRVVPADNGIYFAICPVRATCPYPGRRFARSPAAFTPRRAALELAVRTFLETSTNLVVVSLPTARFILLVLERDDVMGDVDASALRDALAGDPASAPDARLRRIVDRMTLPRLFAPWALVPISETRETLVADCLWPISP